MTFEEELEYAQMSAYGVGTILAEKACEHIGLGVPKVAFALGFQKAMMFLWDRGILSLEQLQEINEEYEPKDAR